MHSRGGVIGETAANTQRSRCGEDSIMALRSDGSVVRSDEEECVCAGQSSDGIWE